ncbi:MAG: oxidoreductase [Dehalococcoidaceae bacterium]|nr:oxidoreductase [Dehalococcoidaceae bacterium]
MIALILFIPFLAAFIIAILPKALENQSKNLALFASIINFIISITILLITDLSAGQYIGVNEVIWAQNLFPFEIKFSVGADALALILIILTNLLTIAGVSISFQIKERLYFVWLMILQGSIIGVFASINLIQFFIFWELELVPMFMLINFWGTGNREYSAMKFVLYTLVASAFILIGVILLGYSANSFNIIAINNSGFLVESWIVIFAFWTLLIGFLIKLPIFPFHTWLPDAHTDAPTAVSVILAGILLKMGGYGIIKIVLPTMGYLLNDYGAFLGFLGAFSIIYGAIQTLKQSDLKRVIAFSSISHMGFVLVGIASNSPIGILGAGLQLITHGLISGLLFLCVGLVYERTETREITKMQGLTKQFPLVTLIMMTAGLASLGLPGLVGFIAEITIFIGSFDTRPITTIFAITGVLFSAGYILWTMQRIFFGPSNKEYHSKDISDWPQFLSVGALLLPTIIFGVYPQPLITIMEHGLNFLI